MPAEGAEAALAASKDGIAFQELGLEAAGWKTRSDSGHPRYPAPRVYVGDDLNVQAEQAEDDVLGARAMELSGLARPPLVVVVYEDSQTVVNAVQARNMIKGITKMRHIAITMGVLADWDLRRLFGMRKCPQEEQRAAAMGRSRRQHRQEQLQQPQQQRQQPWAVWSTWQDIYPRLGHPANAAERRTLSILRTLRLFPGVGLGAREQGMLVPLDGRAMAITGKRRGIGFEAESTPRWPQEGAWQEATDLSAVRSKEVLTDDGAMAVDQPSVPSLAAASATVSLVPLQQRFVVNQASSRVRPEPLASMRAADDDEDELARLLVTGSACADVGMGTGTPSSGHSIRGESGSEVRQAGIGSTSGGSR